jgi:PEP-CTERM/exosortase A-associated glycosyltransferase
MLARGIAAERITVIPNAVNVQDFQRGQAADPDLQAALGLKNATVLGFIGSFYAYEGLDLLLRATPALLRAHPQIKILLVGGGPEEAALKALAHNLGIEGQVVFVGRVPHDQVRRYYDLVDVLVYPRHKMRLTDLVTPLKPLEAMAQERLLLASDVGGHRELIRHGETGALFAADDVDALVRETLALLSAPHSWPMRRAAARTFVEQERNWTASVARYPEVYARAQAHAGKRRL